MPKKLALIKKAAAPTALLSDVRSLILGAREGVARAVNAGLTALYSELAAGSGETSSKSSARSMGGRLSPHWGDNWRLNLASGSEKNRSDT